MNTVKYVSHISESHHYSVNFFGGYLNKSFIDFLFLLCKNKSFVFECSRAMPATRAIKEIRSDASSSHSLFRLVSFFLLFCLCIFCLYLCCLFLLLSRRLSPPLFVSPPFCGWQSPWDYAHSKLENLKLCPNTSFQDLPREIPHGCLYATDLPVCLASTSLPQLLSHELLEHHPC